MSKGSRLEPAERVDAMTDDERRDSIAAYLRGRATMWHEMATHFQAEGQLHVAERFGGASRLAYDAVLDIEADVDLRADAPVADPDMLVELARFALADALLARLQARGWSEHNHRGLMSALGSRDAQDRWATSRGHAWRSDGGLTPAATPPYSLLDIARAAGATDPELYVGPPMMGGRAELRLVIGPGDPGRKIAQALADDDPVATPRVWVGDELYKIEVADRYVHVSLSRRAAPAIKETT